MKVINCECGYVARGETEEEVVSDISKHLTEVHPDMSGKVSRNDLLGWIEEV